MSNEWPRPTVAVKGRIVYSAQIEWTKTCANHQGPTGKRGHKSYCSWHCKNAVIDETSRVVWDKNGGPCLVAPGGRKPSDWDSLNPRFAESLYKPNGIQDTLRGAGLTPLEVRAVILRADGNSWGKAAQAFPKPDKRNVRQYYERGKAKLAHAFRRQYAGLI